MVANGGAAPESPKRFDQVLVAHQRREIDIVNKVEKGAWRNAVQLHQPLQRRPKTLIVIEVDRLGRAVIDPHVIGDKHHNALLELGMNTDRSRIERVVEIKHPRIDMREQFARTG